MYLDKHNYEDATFLLINYIIA